MKIPSAYTILLSGFCLFLAYNFLSFLELATSPLECSEEPCLKSILNNNPNMRMKIFTTFSPYSSIVNFFDTIQDFDYRKEFKKDYNLTLPMETRYNGTLWMLILVGEDDLSQETTKLLKLSISEYAIPGLDNCKPLGVEGDDSKESLDGEKKELKPVTHVYKNIYLTLLTEKFTINQKDIPFEMEKYIKTNKFNEILPILEADFLKMRYSDLVEVDENMTTFQMTLHYNPISFGWLRFILQVREVALDIGFDGLALDEAKECLQTKNIYMLCIALGIFQFLSIFYILSFRNEILFWKMSKSYVGLSVRTILLKCFGMITMFLFFKDEGASLLVLIPASIVAALELWKCTKILKIEFTFRGIRLRTDEQSYKVAKAEKETQKFDKQAMKYLSFILIPLFIGGAVYYLIYPPFRSWYSWTLASLANGLHIFGWLFMFPQLFVNYKMKSVAALPWRVLLYRAIITLLYDTNKIILGGRMFFNINFFREDVIFIIFLYQWWIYPSRKTLNESSLTTDDETEVDSDPQEVEEEKKDN